MPDDHDVLDDVDIDDVPDDIVQLDINDVSALYVTHHCRADDDEPIIIGAEFDDFGIAIFHVGEPGFIDLCHRLVKQLGLAVVEHQRIVDERAAGDG